jgi:hypothetical protein
MRVTPIGLVVFLCGALATAAMRAQEAPATVHRATATYEDYFTGHPADVSPATTGGTS